MKKLITYTFIIAAFVIAVAGCKKTNSTTTTTSAVSPTLEGGVLTDFSAKLVNPNYVDIQAKAQIMLTAANTLIATTNDANLLATRTAWKNTRAAWESCEGFLFGPVEDNNYDPTMDDWPVNKVDLDSLLASKNPLAISDIDPLPTTLKGFHAIEYIIFGVGSTRKAADITAREKVYLASLTESLYNTTTALRSSWDPIQVNNYTAQVNTAGTGSTVFATRQAFFLTLVGTMADICNEVADSKMQTPFAAQDSTLDESSFSHNSTIDFTNNITGVRNAYFSAYNYSGSTSYNCLRDIVKSKNASLDATLQSQINAAIASFGTITVSYEKAIYTQQSQVRNVQSTINTLKATLEGPLTTFIQTYIKD